MEKLNNLSTPKSTFKSESGDAPIALKGKVEDNIILDKSTKVLGENNVEKPSETNNDIIDKKADIIVENKISNTDNLEDKNSKNTDTKVVDVYEIIGGFEDARLVLKKIYNEVFSRHTNFKPTLNDTVADLLSYLGAIAEFNGKEKAYEKAFGVDVSRLPARYKDKGYIPYAIKISVWVDKNKGYNETPKLLDGILRSLFSLLNKGTELETVSIIQDSISAIIDFLKAENINVGF